ncbi:MAG: hypothetical protein AAFX76_06165, partial [Planctomycetota bacterium]
MIHRLLFLLLLCVVALPARADQVRVNNIWVPDVRVISVRDGEVHYVTAVGRDVRRPRAEVEGIRLDAIPEYARGVELVGEGHDAAAVPMLVQARRTARSRNLDWVGHEAGMQLAAALDRLNMGADAAEAYLELMERRAGPEYLVDPPRASVAALPADQRQRLRRRVERSLGRLPEAAQPHVGRFVAALSGSAAARPVAGGASP